MHRQKHVHRWHNIERREHFAEPEHGISSDTPLFVLGRRGDGDGSCKAGDTSASCEKPSGANNSSLPIILGAAIPIIIAMFVLVYLHRRHVQKLKREDALDKTKSMDFGIDIGPAHRSASGPGEKNSRSRRQLSMDMEIASPYLMPVHDSRDSLGSLTRSGDDRYGRPMTAQSAQSQQRQRGDSSSYYAHSVHSPDGSQMSMNTELLGNAQRMSTSTPPPPRGTPLPRPSHTSIPEISIPVPAATKMASRHNGLPASPRAGYFPTQANGEQFSSQKPATELPGLQVSSPITLEREPSPSPSIVEPTPQKNIRPISDDQSEYGDGIQFRISTASITTKLEDYPNAESGDRRTLAPESNDGRRLSMGFRPLPPDGKPDDSAEERALRIRSFYKEYFDDSAPPPPMPNLPLPAEYEDYSHYQTHQDDSSAVFDPETGRYMIPGAKPFAEPPARRAMTPPPRAPPRFADSRAGSAAGSRPMPPGPRSYSSASGQLGPPRGRPPPPQRKPFAPPKPLNLMPTPGKLGENAFASPTMFAPTPRVIRDSSEIGNLHGGTRPYSPSVSPHVPLASAFEELASLPTPAMLRKSGTYTALDFAPPRKFKNDDVQSDAGSIRSDGSNMSALQIQNIRNGAYRVSRIPTEVVPLKDAMADSLKPKWDMRNR